MKELKNKAEEMRCGSLINVKNTVFWHLKVRGAMIKVITKNGWESDTCEIDIEESLPGGLWVSENSKEYFVPFSSIDHYQVFGRR